MVATHGWKTVKHGSRVDRREFQEPGLGRPEVPSPFQQLPRQAHQFVMLFSDPPELSEHEDAVRLSVTDAYAELLGEYIGGLTGTESDEVTYGIVGTPTVHNIGLPNVQDDVFPWDTVEDEDGELWYDDSAPTHLLHPRELGIKPLHLCVGTTGQVDCTHGYYSGDDEYLGDTNPGGFLVRNHP